MNDDLNLSVRLRADGKGLTGEFNVADKQVDKLIGKLKKAGEEGHKSGKGIRMFGRRAREAADSTVRLEKNTNSLAKSLVSVKGIIATMGLGLLTKSLITTGAEFYQQMANVGSVAGASEAEIEQLTHAAREQAKVSIFASREVAEAQYYLASAGMTVNQIIASQGGVMELAAATQHDLASTSEITTSTLSQFNLKASESARVANVYAGAISGSQATMDKLGDSMRYVGPVANALDVSLESTTASLEMLYNAGFKGEQAGTALRMAMVMLNKPSKEGADLMAQLGIHVNDASGHFVGMESILHQLEEAQLDVNDAATLFGAEAAPAMLSMARQGAGEFAKLRDEITGTNKAAEMADLQMDTLAGDWKLFLSSAEELSLFLYDKLEPSLRSTVVWLKNITDNSSATIDLGIDMMKADLDMWVESLRYSIDETDRFITSVSELHNEFISFLTLGKAKNFTEWLSFIVHAILDLPVNLKTAATIMIAEGDKLRIGIVAYFEQMGVDVNYGIDEMGHNWTLFTLGMKDKFYSALDLILQRFAEWMRGFASVIPDLGPLEGFSAKITAAADGMQVMGNKAADVKKAIAEEEKAFSSVTQVMVSMTAEIDRQADASRDAADTIIDAALQERTATLAARDAKVELLQAERKKQAAAQAARDAAVKEAEAAKKAAGANKEQAQTASYVAQIYKDTATSMRGAFSGAFSDILEGQNTFTERMLDGFKKMLADMATMAIARPIMIPVVSGLGGALGISDEAQSSVIKELGGTDGITPFMSQAGEMMGAGMVGYLAGGALAKAFDVANPGMTENLSGLGSAIGMGIGGPVGAAVGGALGFAVGGLFGGNWQTTGAGLQLDYSSAGVGGYAWQTQSKEGGWFGSDQSSFTQSALDSELVNSLNLAFDTFEQNFSHSVERLGIGDLSALGNVTTSATLQTLGLSEDELSQAIADWVEETSLEMAEAVLPGLDAFKRAGEDAGETLERLGASLELMYNLGRNLDITIASLEAGDNAARQFGIQIQYASQDIAETTSLLADTRDMQDRIALEQQLSEQVVARYELEQQMLQQLQQSIGAVIADLASLRGDISGDISTIIGAGPRSLSAIGGDLAGIIPGAAPSAGVYSASIQQLTAAESLANSLLNNIVANQAQAASLEASIAEQQADLDTFYSNLESYAHDVYLLQELNNTIAEQQAQYTAQLDLVAELQAQADAALTDYNAEMNDYLGLTNDQVDQLRSLREETIAYYNAMAQLDNAMHTAAANLGSTLDSLYLGSLSPAVRLAELESRFSALSSSAAGATGYDLVSISDELNAMVSPLLSEAEGFYASGAGYQDIYDEVVATLSDLQQRLLDEAPQGYEESTLTLLTSIDGLLGNMEDVLSAAEQAIVDAIDTSRQYTVGTLEDIRELLGGEGRTLASYDVGTAYVPGDMTANIHKGEIIIDPQSSNILRKYGIPVSGSSSSEVVAALARIERQLSDGGGDLHLKVVTEDGRVVMEKTIATYQKRLQRGEYTVPAKAVTAS